MGLKQLCDALALLGSANIDQLSQSLNIPVHRIGVWLAQLERMGKVEVLNALILTSQGCAVKSPYCSSCTQSGCKQTETKQTADLQKSEKYQINNGNERRYKLVNNSVSMQANI